MILGFKERFKAPIWARVKIHSIREDKKNKWRPGRFIHFATGVRTYNYHQFHSDTCKSIQSIRIEYEDIQPIGKCVTVFIDGQPVEYDIVEKLAVNDGFESISDFFEWFDKDFKGKIIHWTDFKY